MRNYVPWLFIGLGLFLLILAGALLVKGPVFGKCVGILRISGPITLEGEPPSLTNPGQPGSADFVKAIKEADEDPRIASLLVVVNSPGGGVVPSWEIYEALREAKKPVVVYIEETGASGGYLVALGGDVIVAHPMALVGNIGVRASILNFHELLEKLGVRVYEVSRGKFKGALAPWKENYTSEELALLSEMINGSYEKFVQAVLESRGRVPAEVFESGVYLGEKALKLGLVDQLGNFQNALEIAAALGDVSADQTCELTPEGGSFPLGSGATLRLEYR